MKIKDLGGEFALIDRVTRKGGAVVGVGDDAAVLEGCDGKYFLFTADMLCEGDHFRRKWSSPQQIGAKALVSNVSDIAAMGGLPTYATISLSLPDDVEFEFVQGFYEGVYSVCDAHDFHVVGGDTTHGKNLVVSVAILGVVEHDLLCLRSGANPGELLCVTGDLGKSMAALELLRNDAEGDVTAHLSPEARVNEARAIAPYATSMIDVSDGLASEVNHVCTQSKVGALIEYDKIPVSDTTRESAAKLGADPIDYALSGGEDFELVFTVKKEDLEKIDPGCAVTVVGEMTSDAGTWLVREGENQPLMGGYNHFHS